MPEAKKRGRPATNIPLPQLEALCQVHATDAEIAAHFGCSTKTIERLKKKPRYASVFERGRADGKISLRRAQYQEALKGSPSMLIWLGKQLLGQKEKIEASGPNGGPIQIEAVRDMLDRMTDEDFKKLAQQNGISERDLQRFGEVIDITPTRPVALLPAPDAGDTA
jgi:hypothetical protein